MLNDDFYNFMMDGRTTVDGVSILSAEYIIPFKMFAWLNLMQDKAKGKHVNDRDLRKHKNDVFRLLQIVSADVKVESQGMVKQAIADFLENIETEPIKLSTFGIEFDKTQALELLKQIYAV